MRAKNMATNAPTKRIEARRETQARLTEIRTQRASQMRENFTSPSPKFDATPNPDPRGKLRHSIYDRPATDPRQTREGKFGQRPEYGCRIDKSSSEPARERRDTRHHARWRMFEKRRKTTHGLRRLAASQLTLRPHCGALLRRSLGPLKARPRAINGPLDTLVNPIKERIAIVVPFSNGTPTKEQLK